MVKILKFNLYLSLSLSLYILHMYSYTYNTHTHIYIFSIRIIRSSYCIAAGGRYEFGTVRFENIDVSNVIWSEAVEPLKAVRLRTHSMLRPWQGHLSELFATLRSAGATSQRIKVRHV